MVTVGSKTPVSILQEYGTSKGLVPSYELIVNNTGTHNAYFKYRVTLGDKFADGGGTSKQRAKHIAAELLLDVLQHSEEARASNLQSATKVLSLPQENVIDFNAVGALKEYCEEKQCPEPEFTLVQDEGPPHAKIFTMKCTVSHLQTFGIARTKKQAKHFAALNMVTKLKELSGEDCTALIKSIDLSPTSPAKSGQRQNNDAEAEEVFRAKSKLRRKANNSAYIGDQHKSILNLVEKSVTLTSIISSGLKDTDDKVDILQAIANETGFKILRYQGPSNCLYYFVKFTVKPVITCCGETYREAAEKALTLFLSYFGENDEK